MYLKIDDYTNFILRIDRTHKEAKNWDDKWCEVTLRIENEYFNYKRFNNEILLESEIEFLITELNKLVKGELLEEKIIDFIEPDLEFKLMPSKEIEDSLVNIKINLFQNGILSADYYNLCINMEEVEQILVYLNTIIPTIDLKDKKYKYKDKRNYCFVSVKYDDYKGEKTYMYILTKDIDETNVGDTVIVDRVGKKVRGTIIDKCFYRQDNAPYPVKLTKEIIKVLKTPDDFKKYMMGKNKKYRCPCCGYYTLDEVDSYEVCPVCYWKDDPVQRDILDYECGANIPSLNQAKENYKEMYSVEERFNKKMSEL